LRSLYAGQPQRATQRPTTERLLQAFEQLTLTIIPGPRPQSRHLPPLPARSLALLDLAPTLYTDLAAA